MQKGQYQNACLCFWSQNPRGLSLSILNRVDDTSFMNISVYTDACITQFARILKIVWSLKSNIGRNSVYLGATMIISLYCTLPLFMVALLLPCESCQALGDTTPLVPDVAPLCAPTNS